MPLRIRSQRLGSASLAVLLSMTVAAWPCAAVPPPLPNRPMPQPARGPLADKLAKLMADGTAALIANDPARAQPLLEQAFRIKPTPELLYQLGKVAEAQGQSIVAADLYRRYLETGATATDEKSADSLRKQVLAVPPSVSEVTVAGSSGAFLLIDGRLVGTLPLNRPLLLAPGPHRYRLESRGITSESAPLTTPDGRTAELHLTAGSSGSLIAVLTVHSLAILSITASGLVDDQKKQVEESIIAAARNEHAIILPPDKVAELVGGESPSCLQHQPCLDRISQKSEVRSQLTYSLKSQDASTGITVMADLLDLASGLHAAHLEETIATEVLGSATLSLTRRLFQIALSRPRGTLQIESNPPSATVSVDGRVLGATPLSRVTLSGSHVVTIELTDHEPYQSKVAVAPGSTVQITADLLRRAPPPPPPPPVLTTIPGESARSRNLRWIFGGVGLVTGVTLTGLGIAALSQNGSCGDNPAPSSGTPCELLYNTAAIGGGLVGAGIGLTVGGALIMFWPSRKPRQVATPSSQPSAQP